MKQGIFNSYNSVLSLSYIYKRSIKIYNHITSFTECDVLGSYSRVLTKYFIAEGVVCKHDLLLFSADENPEAMVRTTLLLLMISEVESIPIKIIISSNKSL